MGAELYLYDEFREELYGDEFPLYGEPFAPRSGAAYQRCKTGTRYWRAAPGESVDGEWCVYVRVYGPRGTEHGWTCYTPDEAREKARAVRAAIEALTDGRGPVLALWYAPVKGEDQHYKHTRADAVFLALCLETQAGKAEEQAADEFEAWVTSLAPYDVPGLPDGVPA